MTFQTPRCCFSRLTALATVLATIALGSALPTQAAQAQQCVNSSAPTPLGLCVHPHGNHQVWIQQPNGRVYQYFNENSPANGWLLSLLNGSEQLDWGYYIPTTNRDAPGVDTLSNTLSGTGTSADPWVIRTELAMPSPNIELVQELIYINGERSIRKRWTVRNNSAVTYQDLRFFHGGDAYFGGTDDARGWYEAGNQMVYLTNRDFNYYGYMGMAAHPATPSSRYHSGSYSAGRNSARARQLTNTIASSYVDAGYYLQWNQAGLGAGEQWVIEAREIWTPPGIIQSFAPAPTYVAPDSTRTLIFKVQNVAETPVTFTASASLSGDWSAALDTTEFTLEGLAIAEIPVQVTLPAGATGTQTLTLNAISGSTTSSAATTLSVLDLDYSISPQQVDFGPAIVGATSERTVTFTNLSSTSALTLGQLNPAHTLGAAYGTQNDQCSGQTLAGGSSCSVTLSHTPSSPAANSGTLSWPVLAPVLTTLDTEVSASAGHIIVSTSAGAGGSLSPQSFNAQPGQQASFTIQPDAHHQLVSVSGCNGTLNDNVYTTGNISQACTVTAAFQINQYQVTSNPGVGGSVSPTQANANHGDSLTFTLTPSTGTYIHSALGCNGRLEGNQYIIDAVTSSCDWYANFALIEHPVTATSSGNGSITPASGDVTHGNQATFTVTPDTGYSIGTVSGCSGTLDGNQYTTGTITGACAVTASFTLNHYDVTASSSGNGSITPPTSSIAHGQRATFTVTAEDGYRIRTVTGCDGTLEAGTYTTAEITEDCAITASFERSLPLFVTDLSVPLDLNANALHTELPESMYPQATAADGSVLQVTLASGATRFLPGRHELQWQVVDTQGRSISATQILRVWPSIAMGKDVHAGLRRGDHGAFRIALSGPAPEYPFEVNYEVGAVHPEIDLRAGRVRFEAGELEKDVHFAVIAEPAADIEERNVTVWLSNARNTAARDRLTVQFTRTNLAPTVSVQALRDGDVAGAFDRHGSPITLQAFITDPNAQDSHQLTWDLPAGVSATASGEQLIVDASSLLAGVHRFQVQVQDDGQPAQHTTAMIELVLLDQAPTLPAGATGWQDNGLPDHPDHTLPMRNVLPQRGAELHHYLLETQPGLQLALGAHARLADAAQAQIEPEALALPADSISNVGGYFDFQISALPAPGQTASIVLPQREAIPEQAVYRKFDARQQHWYTFVEDQQNELASAPGTLGHCPPPDSTLYSEGLTAGDWCVRLTLQDGGPNDGDGQTNGVILDPGGVGRQEAVSPGTPPSPPAPPPAQNRPRGGRGSTDAWLLLLFVIALLARTTIRSMARRD